MNPLERFRNHRLDPQQRRALGSPVAAGPRAIFNAAKDHQGHPGGLPGHRGIEDRCLLPVRPKGIAALDPIQHLVPDADIGEGAAHHHLMVAAPRAVGIELAHRHLPVRQIAARRGLVLERSRRADVIGGDHVAQQRQNACALDIADHARVARHAPEIGRVLDIGGRGRPVIGLAVGRFHRLPFFVALEDIGVFLQEGLARDGPLDQFGDLLIGRPDVPEVDGRAVLRYAQRFGGQIDVHITRQRIGHHQRRRGQVVGAHIGRNPPLEVAVAGQHGSGHQIALVDCRRNLGLQRAGVADAGGAAIAHQVEAHGIQVFLQPGGVQIFADHLASGGQRGLDPGLARQPQRAGLARHQSGPDHDIGVRGIGAGGDRGDDHLARGHGEAFAFDRHLDAHGALEAGFHFPREGCLGIGQRQEILRALRPGNCGNNLAHVQMQGVGINRVIACIPPHPVRACIGFDQRHAPVVAAGLAQIAQRFAVNREKAAGRPILGGHVGDGGPVGQRQAVQPLAVEFHELVHHALLAQHLHDLQHKVGGRGAFAHGSGQLEAHHLGDQHRHRLAQHRRFRFNPAHAPTQHGQAVYHRGVAVGAHQSIRVGHQLPMLIGIGPDGLRQIFQVDLMANAGARRHDAEIVERLLPPFQEGIAFHVPFVLAVHVHLKGAWRAEFVDHHRMVNHQIDRVQRVDLLGVAAQAQNAIAHRRQVNHGRNPGEILHQHAGRAIGDFARIAPAVRTPFGKGADVVDRNRLAILEPQHVFQHHLKSGGQAGKGPKPGGLCGGDRVVGNGLAACGQGLAGLRAVMSDGDGHSGLLAVATGGGCKGIGDFVCNCMPKIQSLCTTWATDHRLARIPSQFLDWRLIPQLARTGVNRRQDTPYATCRQRHIRTLPCRRRHGRGPGDIAVCGRGRTLYLAGMFVLPAGG